MSFALAAALVAFALRAGGQPPARNTGASMPGSLASPRHTGAELVAMLQRIPDGQQVLAHGGFGGAGTSTPSPAPAPRTAAGWPTNFDINVDVGAGFLATTVVGSHSVTTRLSYTGVSIRADNLNHVAAFYESPGPGYSAAAHLSADSLPPGWYLIAFHMLVASGGVAQIGARQPPGSLSFASCPAAMLTSVDSHNVTLCAATFHFDATAETQLHLFLMGDERLLGATISRIGD